MAWDRGDYMKDAGSDKVRVLVHPMLWLPQEQNTVERQIGSRVLRWLQSAGSSIVEQPRKLVLLRLVLDRVDQSRITLQIHTVQVMDGDDAVVLVVHPVFAGLPDVTKMSRALVKSPNYRSPYRWLAKNCRGKSHL